jgi:hypothetical protein
MHEGPRQTQPPATKQRNSDSDGEPRRRTRHGWRRKRSSNEPPAACHRIPPGPRHRSFDFTATNQPRRSRGHAEEEPTTATIATSPPLLAPSSLPQKPRRQHRRLPQVSHANIQLQRRSPQEGIRHQGAVIVRSIKIKSFPRSWSDPRGRGAAAIQRCLQEDKRRPRPPPSLVTATTVTGFSPELLRPPHPPIISQWQPPSTTTEPARSRRRALRAPPPRAAAPTEQQQPPSRRRTTSRQHLLAAGPPKPLPERRTGRRSPSTMRPAGAAAPRRPRPSRRRSALPGPPGHARRASMPGLAGADAHHTRATDARLAQRPRHHSRARAAPGRS